MLHFARIDKDNIVLQVIIVDRSNCCDEHNNESEIIGKTWLENFFKNTGDIYNNPVNKWVQTSKGYYDRKNFAAPGYKYDTKLNAFVAPKPTVKPLSPLTKSDLVGEYELNVSTCQWEFKINGEVYNDWDENPVIKGSVNTGTKSGSTGGSK